MAVCRDGHQLKPAKSVWSPECVEQAGSHGEKHDGLPDGRSTRVCHEFPIGQGTERSSPSFPFDLQPQLYKPVDCRHHISPAGDPDFQLCSVSTNYGVGSIHSKGDLPYSQTRLRKTAKALIFVIRPQNAAAHLFGPLCWALIVQHRSDDKQHKKDRQQHWGYQPLTKIE
jgi:hypothetical protein